MTPSDIFQPAAGDKTTGAGTSVFSKDGAVGSMFNGTYPLRHYSHYGKRYVYGYVLTKGSTADGPLGGTAQKIGGPLDKQGAIGKNFNADGKIGGMVQQNLADNK